MPTIEQSLTHEEGVSSDKVRLIASGEFLRAYDRSAWKFHCCLLKFKVIKKYSKQRQRDGASAGKKAREARRNFRERPSSPMLEIDGDFT